MSVYTDSFNEGNYDFVYNNINDSSKLEYGDFLKVINIMYDKNNLKNIYYSYYSDHMSLDSFMSMYYYGNSQIKKDDISFIKEGETDLFHRSKFKYNKINAVNGNGYKSSLGVKENVSFEIENNSELVLDGNKLNCVNNICLVDYIFGGLHEIEYVSNGYDYYGIINVYDSEQLIYVAKESSLVKKNISSEEVFNEVTDFDLKYGKYSLKDCYLSSGCPSKKSSYIDLRADGTVEFFTYITLDQAGDYYLGTYDIQGDFLTLYFDSHIYSVFDYDTKQSTDINADVDIVMNFKLEENNIINDSYMFQYSM